MPAELGGFAAQPSADWTTGLAQWVVRHLAERAPEDLCGALLSHFGIGGALAQAHKAVEGDIVGVTVSLGVAFNSTFIALVISIVIMFLMHQLQLLQERLVLDTQNYVDTKLIRHMQVRSGETYDVFSHN